MELCPICIDKEAFFFTECNHGYCVSCLCRIKKCSMCRKQLLRNKLCDEIKFWHTKKNILLPKESNSSRLEINLRPEDLQLIGLIGLENFSLSNIIQSSYNNQSNYSFYIPPENHRPSGTGGGSRVTD